MVEREFLQDLIRRAFREWAPPAASQGGQASRPAVLQPTWLSAAQLHELIKHHATQLPGVAADKVRKITRDRVETELLAMPDVRRRDLNTPREAFSLLP